MTTLDFGKNTQQCSISFRFDCITGEMILGLVQHFAFKKKLFSAITKGEGQQVILTEGDGSEARPYYQLRISPSEILIWSGWNAKYQDWQQRREVILSDLFLLLEKLPVEFASAAASQMAIGIPAAKLKQAREVSELEPTLAIYGRFLPQEMTETSHTYVMSNSPDGKQTIAWWTGPPSAQSDETVSCSLRLNILNMQQPLNENILAHTKTADDLFHKFQSSYLSMFVKP